MTWPRTTRHPLPTAAGVALIGLLVACSGTSSPSATTQDRYLSTSWLYANHDLNNTRATTDSTINSSNVSQLGIAWTHPIAGVGAYGGAASTPLVSNGTVYFQDLGSNVMALNVDDGSEVWTTKFNHPVIGPNGPAQLTINDDDVSTFNFSSGAYFVQEDDPAGHATITVNRAGASIFLSAPP